MDIATLLPIPWWILAVLWIMAIVMGMIYRKFIIKKVPNRALENYMIGYYAGLVSGMVVVVSQILAEKMSSVNLLASLLIPFLIITPLSFILIVSFAAALSTMYRD